MSTIWRVWLRWSLASLAGLVARVVLFLVVGGMVDFAGVDENVPDVVFGALDEGSGLSETKKAITHPVTLAVMVGVAQWVVLRARLHYTRWWIPATLVAWACGEVVGRILMRLAVPPVELLGLILVPQLVLGAALAYLLPTRSATEVHPREVPA